MNTNAVGKVNPKTLARPTAQTHTFKADTHTVEVVVFSPEIVIHKHAAQPHNDNPLTRFYEQTAGQVQGAGEWAHDITVGRLYNPGHVGLHIGAKLYNFGRYWKEDVLIPGTGSAVLREDDCAKYIRDNMPKRAWIYGYTVVVKSVKPIQQEVDARWQAGIQKPGVLGRKVAEYNIVNNSCKTFTLDLLTKGGVTIPSYFSMTDFPADVRTHFDQWHQESPKEVTLVKAYKKGV